eukprot:CAMPEP_0117422532 /NCGR_PEP_ID=MMETSP0758-20121206/3348_1 /TAXON_ID=63605 /ORGANISM="Percolomonas cosmopolitus, Strain AE-1 (ATCC 50343)" /LENGTH=253 /DNA_ID=CAMNT_0005205199 /DNA_START=9 /DNA_END=767 /DNA_ORIENTATION=+
MNNEKPCEGMASSSTTTVPMNRKEFYNDLINGNLVDEDDSDDDYNPDEDDAMIDDSEGYESNEDEYQQLQKKNKKKFYRKGEDHWNTQKPIIHDMVGGNDIHDFDIRVSTEFIKSLKLNHKKQYSLDVGAGIGRLSQYLLKDYKVRDLVDRSSLFLSAAKKAMPENTHGSYIESSLENLIAHPELLGNHYQMIWIQYVLMYLLDDDLVNLLEILGQHLTEDGVLVIRESCCPSSHRLLFDEEDSSTTRSDGEW